jgi:hypothetical protein
MGVAFFVFFSGGVIFYRNAAKNIRKQILAELQGEIKKVLKAELGNYPATGDTYTISGENKEHSMSIRSQVKPENGDFKEKELCGRIKEIVQDELHSYVAGELAQEAPLTGGLKKKYEKLKTADPLVDEPQVTKSQAQAEAEEKEFYDKSKPQKGKENIIEKTLVEKGGMLIPRGKLQIEPSFTFAHFSSNRINIQGFSILPVLIIGDISTEAVKRDIFIQNLSLKYGIYHNLQGDLKVPHRYEFDRITDNVGAESTRSYSGLGDVEFGLSRQIAYENGMIPDTIFSLSTKSNSGKSTYNRQIGLGTGHWAVRGSLVAAKSSDPTVVFGSLNYTWNIKRKIANYGEVDPGDSIGYSLGTAIALSYQTAINFGYEQSVTFKMKRNKMPVNGSFLNSASLKYGFTWSISDKSSVDFSVSTGLTTDAPDYVVEVRFPYAF